MRYYTHRFLLGFRLNSYADYTIVDVHIKFVGYENAQNRALICQ